MIALAATACDRSPALSSCEDPLGGVYAVDDRRWMILDHRPPGAARTLEAYPLFADVPAVEGLEVAPRVIDLDAGLAGVVRRRYLRAATSCTSKVPARITACAGDTVDVVLAEPPPPTRFAPCVFGRAEPSRRERWTRVE